MFKGHHWKHQFAYFSKSSKTAVGPSYLIQQNPMNVLDIAFYALAAS